MNHQLQRIRQGIEAANKGDLQTAEHLFRLAWQQDTENEGLLFNLIRCLYMQRKCRQVVETYASLHNNSLKPLSDSTVFVLMQSANQCHDVHLYRECVKELHNRRPSDPDVCVQMSAIYIADQMWDLAQAILEQALRDHPNDPCLLTNLAIVYSECGEYKHAELCYRDAVRVTPRQFIGHYNLAKFLMLIGRHQEAKESLLTCLQIVPNAPEAKKALSQLTIDDQSTASLSRFYAFIEKREWDASKECLMHIRSEISLFEFMAAASELNHEDQDEISLYAEYDLDRVVSVSQLLLPTDSLVGLLISELRNNRTLVLNRAGKPTISGLQTHEIFSNTNSPSFQELRIRILRSCEAYIKSQERNSWLNVLRSDSARSLSGWGVILRDGGYQKRHVHPEGIISGVVYLQTPDLTSSNKTNEGNLVFSLDKPLEIIPAVGNMVLFPSYLPHETIAIHGNVERICIAFNVS
jgi:tetratricopeptide (TPR) repeat protein